MIAALDTNILLDLLIPNEQYFDASYEAVRTAATEGAVVICDLVYAELCLQFPSQHECDQFLEQSEILVESLTRRAHFLASRIHREYRNRGGKRSRILGDFLVAAHAQIQPSYLVTRDRGFYSLLPSLRIIDPTCRQ
jgi:predicted nucleic acid-binding protein